jgi:hypothetical protein
MSRDPEEERFARQDKEGYSDSSSAFTIAAMVIVVGIVLLVYLPKAMRRGQATEPVA